MSTSVDNQVVRLRLENEQYEAAAKSSVETTERLKKSLNFDGAGKGLEELSKKSKAFSFDSLGKSIETISSKFTNLGIVGVTALQRITNQAIDAGEKIVKSLTIDPPKQGFSEYELKMGSIQTIMAGTGESLQTVNKYLNELNTYSDKTIYSFSDMTANIGKFTNAGVKLEQAVNAIQGISNLAAVSGANAQQASHSMYNFAQALSAGYVKLMDWKSIEIANMATVDFKNQLLETAVAVGTLTKTSDGMYQTMEGHVFNATRDFNTYLQDAWLSTDVLINTLSKYSDETTEIGKKAFAAAQDVKTFSQLMDTLKEAAGSGWSQTFEILVGDFNQAKKLFTWMSQELGGILDSSAKRRNNLLQEWSDLGGRNAALEIMVNLYIALRNILHSVNEAFRSVFPYMSGEKLYNATVKFKEFTEKIRLTDEQVNNLYRTFRGLFSIVGLFTSGIRTLISAGLNLLAGVLGVVGDDILQISGNVGDAIYNFTSWIDSLHILDKVMYSIGGAIRVVVGSITALFSLLRSSTNVNQIINSFVEFINVAKGDSEKLFSNLGGSIQTLIDGLRGMGAISFDSIKNGFEEFVELIKSGDYDIRIVFEDTSKAFSAFIDSFKNGLDKVLDVLGPFKDVVLSVFGKIKDFVSNIDLGAVLVVALSVSLMKFLGTLGNFLNGFEKIIEGLSGLTKNFSNIFKQMAGVLRAVQWEIASRTAMNMAKTLAVVVGSLAVLTLLDQEKLHSSASVLGLVSVALVAFVGALVAIQKTTGVKDVAKLIGTLTTVSISIVGLVGALKLLDTVRMEDMPQKVLIIGLLAAGLGVLAVQITKHTPAMAKGITGMIGLASAVYVMAVAFEKVSKIEVKNVLETVLMFNSIISALVLLSRAAGRVSAKSLWSLVAVPTSLYVFASALKKLTSINLDKIRDNIDVFAVIIASFGFLMIATSRAGLYAKEAGVAMLSMSSALVIMSIGIKRLSKIESSELNSAMTAVGGIIGLFTAFTAISRLAGVNSNKVSGPIIAMSIGIVAISAAMAGLSILDSTGLDNAVNAIVKMEAVFAVLVASTHLATDAKSTIIAISTAMATLSVLVGAMSLMDAEKASNATKIVAAIGAVLAGIIASTHLVKKANSTLIITTIVIGILAGIVALMSKIDADTALKNCVSISMLVTSMSVLMIALGAISKSGSAVLKGVLFLGAVIAAIASVFAAIGGLTNVLESKGVDLISGINKTSELLGAIGEAFGNFFGSIAGGFASAFSSELPTVADKLADFGSRMKPFFESMKSATKEAVVGAARTVEILLLFTASNLIDSLTSFFSGGRDLENFSEVLGPLADSLVEYSDKIVNVNSGAIESTNEAIRMVISLANSSPRFAGISQAFAGGIQMDVLGDQLKKFAGGIVEYSKSMADFNIDAVTQSNSAVEMLINLANSSPRFYGLKGLFNGRIDLKNLGYQLEKFASSVVKYSEKMVDFKRDSVIYSNEAVEALLNLAAAAPTFGAFKTFTDGSINLPELGRQLVIFAFSVVAYSKTMADFNTDTVDKTTKSLTALILLTNNLPIVASGLKGLFSDKKMSFTSLGDDLKTLGQSMAEYSSSIENVDIPMISQMNGVIASLIATLIKLKDFDSNGVAELCKALGAMADQGLSSGITEGKKSESAASELGDKVIAKLIEHLGVTLNPPSASTYAIEAGKYVVEGLGIGLKDNDYAVTAARILGDKIISSLEKAMGVASPSVYGIQAGRFLAEGVEIGIEEGENAAVARAYEAGTNIINALKSALLGEEGFFAKRSGIIANNILKSSGVHSLTDSILEGAQDLFSTDGNDIFGDIQEKMASFGTDAGSGMIDGVADGITSNGSATTAAKSKGQEIAEALQTELDKIGLRESIRDKEYQLWQSGAGYDATEDELRVAEISKLQKDAADKLERTRISWDAYQKTLKESGAGTQEAIEAYGVYLDEAKACQDILNQIRELQNETTESETMAMGDRVEQMKVYFNYMKDYKDSLLKMGLSMEDVQSLARKEAGLPDQKSMTKSMAKETANAVNTAIGTVGNAYQAKAEAVFGSDLASNFEGYGEQYAASLGIGMTNATPVAVQNADNMANQTTNAVASRNDEWVDVGETLVDKFSEGIDLKAATAAESAARVAKESYAAAMAAIGTEGTSGKVSQVKVAGSGSVSVGGGGGGITVDTSGNKYYVYTMNGTKIGVSQSSYLAGMMDVRKDGIARYEMVRPDGTGEYTIVANYNQTINSPRTLNTRDIIRASDSGTQKFANAIGSATSGKKK